MPNVSVRREDLEVDWDFVDECIKEFEDTRENTWIGFFALTITIFICSVALGNREYWEL